MTDMLVIVGSATPPGRLRRAAAGAVERAGDGVRAELLDLAEVRIVPADGRPPDALGDDTERVVAAIDVAGAVVLATPVYRGSLSGTLKNLLDHVPVAALQGKPVGIAAMGAIDHHFLGAERHRYVPPPPDRTRRDARVLRTGLRGLCLAAGIVLLLQPLDVI
jgi:FMN reductase